MRTEIISIIWYYDFFFYINFLNSSFVIKFIKKIKYHIYVCIFRRNTHLAITKVPASCRNLSNLTPRSIGTSVEEDVGKNLFKKPSEATNWYPPKRRNSSCFASSSSLKTVCWDSTSMQLSSLSSFLTLVPNDQEGNIFVAVFYYSPLIQCSQRGNISAAIVRTWLLRKKKKTELREDAGLAP